MFAKQVQRLEKQETHFNGTIFLSTLLGISARERVHFHTEKKD